MSNTVVINSPRIGDADSYHFEISVNGSLLSMQDTNEPQAIFHDVPPGTYHVDLEINGAPACSGEFVIDEVGESLVFSLPAA